MTVIARHLRKQFDSELEELGVTRSQWTAIAVIVRRPGATQRNIAESLDMSEAAAGRLVDRLCAEGLLRRNAKAGDKRAYCVTVTDASAPILEKVAVIAAKLEERTFSGMQDTEITLLSESLDRLYDNIIRQNR